MGIKNAQSEVSVWFYWTHNRICALVTNVHNDQGYKGIEPTLLSSAAGIKQNLPTIRPRRRISISNKEKYINRWALLPLVKKIISKYSTMCTRVIYFLPCLKQVPYRTVVSAFDCRTRDRRIKSHSRLFAFFFLLLSDFFRNVSGFFEESFWISQVILGSNNRKFTDKL